MSERKNPLPTVDIIIEIDRPDGKKGIVLIERKNPPYGWALPGGFVDYGESLEQAAIREAKEETSLDVELIRQLHTYSEPDRDPRVHTISTVFLARASGQPKAEDDARNIGIFTPEEINFPLAFDHGKIIEDYFQWKEYGDEIYFYTTSEKQNQKDNAEEKEEPLVELTRVWSLAEAEVIKNFLETEGITCLLKGQIVHSLYPFTMDGLGETIVLVLEKDLEKARKLLEEYSPSAE